MGRDNNQRGKKRGGGGRNDQSNPAKVENREAYQRMNFLYQAALLMNTAPLSHSPSSPDVTLAPDSTSTVESAPKQARGKGKGGGDMRPLARFYAQTYHVVQKKLVLRSHPAVKRTFCKYCRTVLVVGVNADVKSAVKAGTKGVKTTCRDCGRARHLPADASKSLYVDGPGAEQVP
ncbi:uncharacterized protein EV422DRAFT_563991 [Fimicolochytrium jonesii]|uniref:uncharacterized protein n=1 Tax=Fimicolochytrium jonesii TaxID=1396493 RepID=UPI0022FE6878|nr:uncharacterized protein EV422DRAFT_563991 [Fimicolochytrium jonesii]KAI8826178.1 hypothetical protein EV422DRAFT_563991 [Fimicolochytrium jonesii]